MSYIDGNLWKERGKAGATNLHNLGFSSDPEGMAEGPCRFAVKFKLRASAAQYGGAGAITDGIWT